nr:hypothetical protein [Tanacetum cinerariifolium]
MSELKQTNQFAEAVSSILGIIDKYLASKMKEAVNVAIQLQTNRLREEAQAKNQEFSIRGRDDQDKDEDPSAGSDQATKRRKFGKDESSKDSRSKEKKSSSTSKDASQSQHKSFGKSVHAEEPNHRGRQIIPKDYFINKDLEYLKGEDSSRRYSTSVTKTKAATYELKWIEDLVPELWSPMVVKYDQHSYFGTSHWGPKRQSFYGYASNLTSSKDGYSRRRIIAITKLTTMKKYNLNVALRMLLLLVRRDDHQLNTFKESDFKRLRLQDIEDMLLLLVQ